MAIFWLNLNDTALPFARPAAAQLSTLPKAKGTGKIETEAKDHAQGRWHQAMALDN